MSSRVRFISGAEFLIDGAPTNLISVLLYRSTVSWGSCFGSRA